MAGLPPGALQNMDAHQRKIILYLEDYAPSTRQEIRDDLRLTERDTGRPLGWLASHGFIHPVGDGWSLTEDGKKAADTITKVSHFVSLLGAPRSGVPIGGEARPAEGHHEGPSADPRTEWAVQVYAQWGSIEKVAKTIHTDQKRAKAILLAAGVELHRLRRQAEAGD